jgi:tRNA pseudouridine55 synthase
LPEAPFGFLNIDKPLGITSHDVVAKVRRAFEIRRVGHAGTLDPLATGVLVVCVGTATRLSEYVMASTKSYRATVRLGINTTTYDAEGEITAEQDASHITADDLLATFPQFTGDIEQLPPMYSAVKQDGKKLYELAREGKTVERKSRKVRIDALTLVDYDPATTTAVIDVTCGSGTYIRSLAFDIGEELGVGAHLTGLVRTISGVFHVEDATPLETLSNSETPSEHLISAKIALSEHPLVQLNTEQIQELRYGRPIDGATLPDNRIAMAYDSHDNLIAIVKAAHGKWKPHKVFSQPS